MTGLPWSLRIDGLEAADLGAEGVVPSRDADRRLRTTCIAVDSAADRLIVAWLLENARWLG